MPSHGIGHILFGLPCTKMFDSTLVDLGFLGFALLPFFLSRLSKVVILLLSNVDSHDEPTSMCHI
jgi:hypothetical protein